MSNQNREQGHIEFLVELKDYSRYLFEEEVKRADRFHGATKTYLLFIGSTLTIAMGIIKWLGFIPSQTKNIFPESVEIITVIILLVAIFFLMLSFVCTILVIKVWKVERLCNPIKFVKAFPPLAQKEMLIKEIIANYVVAADLNGEVNDKKAKLLFAASKFYQGGLFFLLIFSVFYIFI